PIFSDILADVNGPIFYNEATDQIHHKRWVTVLLGEGKDSKQLTAAEEESLFNHVRKMQIEYERGFITPKQLRAHAGMGDTRSEIVLSSLILKKWKEKGELRKVKKGVYQFHRI